MKQEIEEVKIKKPFFNKTFLIILVLCFIFLFIAFTIWLILFVKPKQEIKNEQIVVPTSVNGEMTTAYGIEMKNKCFDKFQGFIKKYGADYSKCLTEFSFEEKYCGGFNPTVEGLSNINIIVILDSSGSMAAKIDSQAKIDIAKQAVSSFLNKIPQGVSTGLIVYGHKSSANKTLSCNGIEEVVKLGRNNASNIINAMSSFSPEGWTPIAGSLDFAKNIFKEKEANSKNYLILVSDGAETCDGDPLISAENLNLEIKNVKLDVIGFAVDSPTRDLLKKIAVQGGGSYITAENSAGIARAFNNELLLIQKDCLYMTFFQMSSRYNANYFDNLNCWFTAQKKESDDFTTNIANKISNAECSLEISKAIGARQNESWYQKEIMLEKNSIIYKKIEADFNSQLKVLESSKK